MNFEEFVIKTKTLEDFYTKELNTTQRQIWFDELKKYSADRYEKAIRKLFKSNQYRPTLSEVLTTMTTVGNGEEQEKTPCNICNGSGYVIYHKKIKNMDYEFACLCTCSNATGKEYNGNACYDHKSDFYIEKAENIFAK